MRSLAVAALVGATAVFSPAAAQVAAAPRPSLTWMSIEVSDIESARRFYVEALGMKQVLTLSKASDPFRKLGFNFSGNPASGEPLLILIHHDRPQPRQNAATGAMLGLIVPDVRAAAAQVRRAGYSVVREPPADARGPILTAIVRDPDGLVVEISQLVGPVTGK